ncbi:MAG: DUF167 domain-containing protein [Nitrososphaeraceae archaeon]|jgi:uncharacterized protein YggU (UPF0235/DUF167 family)
MLCPKPIDLCVKLLFVTDLGLRYTIFVKFNSSGKIEHIGNELTISLKSKPERNKANRELLEKLADYFGTSKDSIHIISGLTSTKKLVDIY